MREDGMQRNQIINDKTFALFTIGSIDFRRKANVLVGSSSPYYSKSAKVLV